MTVLTVVMIELLSFRVHQNELVPGPGVPWAPGLLPSEVHLLYQDTGVAAKSQNTKRCNFRIGYPGTGYPGGCAPGLPLILKLQLFVFCNKPCTKPVP
eukprot:3493481-Rhodomonas_salina.1